MADQPGVVFERLAQLEDELEVERQRVADLQARLGGVLAADAERDTGPRTAAAEGLIRELGYWLDQNPSVRELLPTGFPERLRAQVKLSVPQYHAQRRRVPPEWDEQPRKQAPLPTEPSRSVVRHRPR